MNFNMPWSDALMPVGRGFLAVERSVYECALAGCESIWLVCDKETTPLIRHRLGDWVHDPTINYYTIGDVWNVNERYKQIPIYYIPVDLKEKAQRKSLAYSILFGYKKINRIVSNFSKWATPSKFYVCFPYGVYSSQAVKPHRLLISSKTSRFFKSPDGKTAKDGEYLSFTFDSNEYPLMRDVFYEEEKRLWKPGSTFKDGRFIGEKYDTDERFSGRYIEVKTILRDINVVEDNTIAVPWYYNISSWGGYKAYLASRDSMRVRRPNYFLKYKEFNKIATDSDFVDKEIEIEKDEEDNIEEDDSDIDTEEEA